MISDTCTCLAYLCRSDMILVPVPDTLLILQWYKFRYPIILGPISHIDLLLFLLLSIKNARNECKQLQVK